LYRDIKRIGETTLISLKYIRNEYHHNSYRIAICMYRICFNEYTRISISSPLYL
jgi:hypothetical protein